MKHFNIRVSGRVQGVFFRTSTKEQADTLGLNGFVRNESNGDVYIEAEGDDQQLQEFLNWCKQGPSRARVDELKIQESGVRSFRGFEVKR